MPVGKGGPEVLKAILLILLLWVAYQIFFSGKGKASPPPSGPVPRAGAEQMVTCAYCGLHVPESEAVSMAGRTYCSDEHRRLGAP